MKNVFAKISILIALFWLVLSLCACKASTYSTHNYVKDGVALILPPQWEVFEDFKVSPDHRLISIVTDVGSSVSMNVYPVGGDVKPATLEQVFLQYMKVSLPPQTEQSASIDHGEATAGGAEGRFANVTLGEPFNIQYIVEIYPVLTKQKIAYVIFNTPTGEHSSVKPYIDSFIRSAQLNEST